ncbi:hypothetical protein Tco_0410151 [Tanacetum coccineum]
MPPSRSEIESKYVMPKYENKHLFEDDSWIDIIMDDVYDTFYKDEKEEAKVAKTSKDMKLFIMKGSVLVTYKPNGLKNVLLTVTLMKFLAMVESKKARVKDYTKLVVTDGMVDYVLEKYGNKWKSEDEIAYVILEDLWLKYGKDDKGKGKLVEDNEKGKEAEHHHLKGKGKLVDDNGKGKVDDHDDDALDTLDLENRIKKLKEDFCRLLKAKKAKESKKAKEAKKAREKKKAREAELAKKKKKTRELN